MKYMKTGLLSALIMTGCTIHDPTLTRVKCTGIIHIDTSGRDYSVKLLSRRAGNAGIFYYTHDPAFLIPWINESNFRQVICE